MSSNYEGAAPDPMEDFYRELTAMQQQQVQTSKQGQGGSGGGSLMKMLMGGKGQQQGSFGGMDAGTGDSYTQFSGGDFGGSFGGFA